MKTADLRKRDDAPVRHNDGVEAFSADEPNDPLGEGILPRRMGRDENLVHPHAVDAAVKGVAIDRVTIAEEIPWDCFVGERVNDLLRGPGGGGVKRTGAGVIG